MNDKVSYGSGVREDIRKGISESELHRKQIRLQHNIALLIQGKFDILNNDECVFGLTDFLIDQNKDSDKEKLLEKLGESSLSGDPVVQERSVMILSLAAEKFLYDGVLNHIITLLDLLTKWLRFEDEFIPGHGVIVKRIEELSAWLICRDYWQPVVESMSLFFQIQTGIRPKNRAIRGLITSSQNKLASRSTLERITDNYLSKKDDRQIYKKLLISFGQKAVKYLLQRVDNSQSRPERLLLIELIPCFGGITVPILQKHLEGNPPWAVIRNVLCMMGELREDDLYNSIKKYLNHKNIRVQREAVQCIYKIAGDNMVSRITKALELVDGNLKIKIIRQLAETIDNPQAVAEVIYKVAEKTRQANSLVDIELLTTIAVALKKCPYNKSVELLELMLADYEMADGAKQLTFQINESLRVLDPQVRHTLQGKGSRGDDISFDNDPVQKQHALTKVRKIEHEIKKFMAAGDPVAAGQLVYEESLTAAGRREFIVAELLRDRLLEVNPMALNEVIELGEIIEQEKNSSVSRDYLQIWDELKAEIGSEAFNALYKSLRLARYKKGTTIVRSGEIDTNLYFLNSGHISLSCLTGASETFLKRMQPGDILGGEQFFNVSVWTVTLRAFSEVQALILDIDSFNRVKANFPDFEDHLKKYCLTRVQIPELLTMAGDDRRDYPRYSVTLFVKNTLMDPYGKKGNRSFTGELMDISMAGLAFTIRISSENTARQLLGRQIVTTIPLGDRENIQCVGVIVGVRSHNDVKHDFSLHVKLVKNIDNGVIKKIIALA